jgi:hypothetical protein
VIKRTIIFHQRPSTFAIALLVRRRPTEMYFYGRFGLLLCPSSINHRELKAERLRRPYAVSVVEDSRCWWRSGASGVVSSFGRGGWRRHRHSTATARTDRGELLTATVALSYDNGDALVMATVTAHAGTFQQFDGVFVKFTGF